MVIQSKSPRSGADLGHDRPTDESFMRFKVTRNPDALRIAQQTREAWPYASAHPFLNKNASVARLADVGPVLGSGDATVVLSGNHTVSLVGGPPVRTKLSAVE